MKPVPRIAWEELTGAAAGAVWDRFDAAFRFRPSTTAWPGIREPAESATYDISHVFGDPERYTRLTNDLCQKLVLALRHCVPESGTVYALDWQHPCYRFAPNVPFAFASEDDWPIPALPNGDYYVFLEPELRFGVFGHPWEQTMCVFGADLIDAFDRDPPLLFDRRIRRGADS